MGADTFVYSKVHHLVRLLSVLHVSWAYLALHTLRTLPFYIKIQHLLTVQLTSSSETHDVQRGHVGTGR